MVAERLIRPYREYRTVKHLAVRHALSTARMVACLDLNSLSLTLSGAPIAALSS